MNKAFDSVSMYALESAMRRIRLPSNVISFIKQLYKDKEIRIITEEGPTEFFVAKDRIDQSEVISPLIWRIFYDPLLSRIQQTNFAETLIFAKYNYYIINILKLYNYYILKIF
jgi:hypothetical protein